MNSPSPILTFTGNLLAERTQEFAAWTPGRTQRATRESFQVGGKGINVAKMLRRLGAPVTALCFAGGAAGDECRTWLRAQGFAFEAFATAGATRTGLVVRAPGRAETTFLGSDRAPDAAAWHSAAAYLDAGPADRALALCGSVPGWAGPDAAPFREALDRWLARGQPLFVDAYGPPLASLVARPVALVKINADELRTLLGADATAADTAANVRVAAGRWLVQTWIVTDGPRPVWLAARGETPLSLTPPPVREVSPTGSGDVLLACLLFARLHRGATWRAALEFALPYAAANAAHPGIADFPDPAGETNR
jgi:fructose-1-phosphate kinase PfkB-like protein